MRAALTGAGRGRRYLYVASARWDGAGWALEAAEGVPSRAHLVKGLLGRCGGCLGVLPGRSVEVMVTVAADGLDFITLCDQCEPARHLRLYRQVFGAGDGERLSALEERAPMTFLEFWAGVRGDARVFECPSPTQLRLRRPR